MPFDKNFMLIFYILLINTIFCVACLLFGCITAKRKGASLSKYIIMVVFMFLCPVIGFLFLSIGTLCYRIFYNSSIDLAEITFSKERVEVLEHPDIEEEINLIPMEEAIMIDDTASLRQLLMTVLRSDLTSSINTVTKALNSSDSETSHYAASAIMDIIDTFQKTLQKFQAQLESNPDNTEIMQLYIEYLIKMLNADFLSDLELKTYIYMLLDLCEDLYEKNHAAMKVTYETHLIALLVKIEDIQTAQLWIGRLLADYPDNVEMYRCVLHFYYDIKDKNNFFLQLDKLKKSEVEIDKDLLELIRIFS